jgi:hypothetical protein
MLKKMRWWQNEDWRKRCVEEEMFWGERKLMRESGLVYI